MKLSVIIVNYNVRHFLEQCLKSVSEALNGIEGEVIVVDNNSVDGSVEMVRSKFPQFRLIDNKENVGFSKANNQAIRISSGEYVLLLNPDTVVQEDTFTKCLDFMDQTPDAGGLGVQMIDGKGRFLPESKRGLPTPSVAFYKVFGLSKLFPGSKLFGEYHLGYLPKNQVHQVDVLSGAFMMLRKEVLDQIGLLDEDYFMYGEDIDLSYRIIKAGFKNYYFPETRIIHYKGESTKKSSVNYVIVFYKAMVIFARKHFSSKNAGVFSFFINLAIFFRATVAILQGFFQKILLPLAEGVLFFAGMYFLTQYWETQVKELNYPPLFMYIIVPIYVVVWLTSIFLSGGYDPPFRMIRVVRGVFTGTILILVVYALLSEEYRFSRALILIGTIWAILSSTGLRLLLDFLRIRGYRLARNEHKKLVIVGGPEEGQRVLSILQLSGQPFNFIGYADTTPVDQNITDKEYTEFRLGRAEDLSEIIEVYEINEIIFCGKDISSSDTINQMLLLNQSGLEYKIAPPESPFIIGSNFLDDHGDVYLLDVKAISTPSNRRNKRLFDVLFSTGLLMTFPLFVLITGSFLPLLGNTLKVLAGKLTWVGFAGVAGPGNEKGKMPKSTLRSGVLTPLDGLLFPIEDSLTIERLNVLYAKDYTVDKDIRIVLRSLRQLGKKTA
jgi:GT2 family glycosyltransferase